MPEKGLSKIQDKVRRLRGRRVKATVSDEISRLAMIGQTMPEVRDLRELNERMDQAFRQTVREKQMTDLALRAAMDLLRKSGIRVSKKDLARRTEDLRRREQLLASRPQPTTASTSTPAVEPEAEPTA